MDRGRPARLAALLALALSLPLWGQAAEPSSASLRRRLQSLIDHPGWRRAQVGAQVQSLASGEVLYSVRADVPLMAASLTKLGTALAALKRWGPAHTFRTEIYGRPPDANGTVSGDLVIKAYGDPSMVQERLWTIARELRQRGVERIAGDLVFDGSYLEPAPFPSGWRNVPSTKSYYAPLSPFALNFNLVAVKVAPGPAPGAPAAVASEPESSYIQIRNSARTSSRAGRASIAALSQSIDGHTQLTVRGIIPSAIPQPEVRYFAVVDPLRNYQAALLRLLQEQGIEMQGQLREGPAPPGAPLCSFEGRSLAWILRLMNKFSNNFIADQLLRLLSAETAGPPGTTEKGAAFVRQTLIEAGLDPNAFQVLDGSGLTYENRYSAAAMVRLLQAAYSDFRLRTEFIGSLGINGYDGSIDDRMLAEHVVGLVRAKTGHLNSVTNIAGYVASRDGEVFAFAILANNYSAGTGTIHRLQDQMVSALAEFSR
ncbi:MAG TPA: D-alanyl-D-alanine carboxypeptidase/D-alanyl-D-alanine-endopeptidase [Acidobacteriota bacterium]